MTPVNPDTLEALTTGIQSEVASYVFYREAARRAGGGEISETLEKLALDEKEHFRILERQYDSLVRSEKWISTADILKQDGLPEIDEAMSQQHQGLIDEVATAQSLAIVLDIAYRLEKEANELFLSAMEQVDSHEGKEMFRRLAGFEEGHMKAIDRLRKALG